ncbi:hypothetical protein ABMA27_014686 [Loxostege sticticalis]|uniref:Reverse transcriptase domain-containing protein n=1 Tax=Loxostege sticticalis TaxID=481309 RepID=A0ABR3I9T3_LOXSC
MYADDLQIYISFHPHSADDAIRALNSELNRINEWADNHTLTLNPSKSKFIIFGTKGQIETVESMDPCVAINNVTVERVWKARNLGVTFDACLRFEEHVSELARNCLYVIKVMYKIREYLSQELRKRLSEALVLSKLNYCLPVFGPCLLARSCRLLQRIQNACVRFTQFIPPRTHVTPFINNADMLNMKSRRDLHFASLLFGVVNSVVFVPRHSAVDKIYQIRFIHS